LAKFEQKPEADSKNDSSKCFKEQRSLGICGILLHIQLIALRMSDGGTFDVT
jgi:hypothetical protein